MSVHQVFLVAALALCAGGLGAAVVLVLFTRRLKVGPTKVEADEVMEPVDAAEVAVENGARVFDPNNPPRYATYNPKHYDPERAMKCTCHQRRIEQGDKVLLWPIPDHPEGAMDIFCKDTYGYEGVPY